jgi:NADH-quinone oxidoreductase subunit C
MSAHEQVRALQRQFGGILSEASVFRGETTLVLRDAERVAEVCGWARETLGYAMLLDITSLDHYGEDPRWTVVYELLHMPSKAHLRLKTSVSEERSELPSVTGVWRTADWHEREIYDMMGIRFRGHPDLRRILMWEGYPYFPLRKDFPLAGKATEMPEVAWAEPAPLEGGPFVTVGGGRDSRDREPRSRTPGAEE